MKNTEINFKKGKGIFLGFYSVIALAFSQSLHATVENSAMCRNTFVPVSGQMTNGSGESSLASKLYIPAESKAPTTFAFS